MEDLGIPSPVASVSGEWWCLNANPGLSPSQKPQQALLPKITGDCQRLPSPLHKTDWKALPWYLPQCCAQHSHRWATDRLSEHHFYRNVCRNTSSIKKQTTAWNCTLKIKVSSKGILIFQECEKGEEVSEIRILRLLKQIELYWENLERNIQYHIFSEIFILKSKFNFK